MSPRYVPSLVILAVSAVLAACPQSGSCESCEAGWSSEEEMAVAAISAEQRTIAGKSIDFGRAKSGPLRHARSRPVGAFTGKYLYISAGHGWTWDSGNALSQAWYTQRGNNNGVVEDLGNLDQMTVFAFYCWNAGATVIPLRPIGWQRNEVVLDQDDTVRSSRGIVSYQGIWTEGLDLGYSMSPDAEAYRFAASAASETATARYAPNIPRAGRYPVYTWVADGSDRFDQLYTIGHNGGADQVRIDHRAVGKGWVWLGSYWFEAGESPSQYVEISNVRGSAGAGIAVADAIRFGNGMGNLDFGEGVSGRSREEENARYWAMENQAPVAIYDVAGSNHEGDNVGTPPRMAAYMNNGNANDPRDCLFISFHTNASGRGADGLTNSDGGEGHTPNQDLLALLTGREINQDMEQLSAKYFGMYTAWPARSSHTIDRSDIDFGEILGPRLNGEMDATIVEVAVHGNADDARFLKDSLGRRLIARAVLQGSIRFFESAFGQSLTMPPDEPLNVRFVNGPLGPQVAWDPPALEVSIYTAATPGNVGGDPPTEYRVSASTDGIHFSQVGVVAAAATRQFHLTGYAPGQAVCVSVTSANAGGESFPGNVTGGTAGIGARRVLVVDGFDRMDDLLSPTVTFNGAPTLSNLGTYSRAIPDLANSYDHAIPYVMGLAAQGYGVDTVPNDAVISGEVAMADYDAVVWFTGEESTRTETFGPAEQGLLEAYVAQGGNVLVTGAEVGYDLDRSGFSTAQDRAFFQGTFRASFLSDASGSYAVIGAPGSAFDGLQANLAAAPNQDYYVAEYADVFGTPEGAEGVASYAGVGTGYAIVRSAPAPPRGAVIVAGFPFETIVGGSAGGATVGREEMLSRMLQAALEDLLPQDSAEKWMIY